MRYVTFRRVYGQRDPAKEEVEFRHFPDPGYVLGVDEAGPFTEAFHVRLVRLYTQQMASESTGVFHMPNRSSVDTVLNNHRTLDGMDHPKARLIAKIRTALCNLPSSRQDDYLKSLRLI